MKQKDEREKEGKHEQREAQQEQGEEDGKESQALIQPDSLDNTVCVHSHAVVRPNSKKTCWTMVIMGKNKAHRENRQNCCSIYSLWTVLLSSLSLCKDLSSRHQKAKCLSIYVATCYCDTAE